MTYVVLDFETASASDLKKEGAWKYAESPTTEILCLGYSIDGGDVVVWKPSDLSSHAALMEAIVNPAAVFVAHNAMFEKAIWRKIMVAQYGWPDIPNSRWEDTMAACVMKALPMKLERAALALRLSEQTGKGHQRIVTAPSKPKKDGTYDRSQELLGHVYAENIQDVKCEVELNHRLGGLQPCERQVWLLDQRINERGCLVDLDFVASCQQIIDGASPILVAKFRDLTGGIAPTQRDKVIEWVRAQGVVLPNLQKETIDALLGGEDDGDGSEEPLETPLPELPGRVREALAIRRKVGSASIKKLASIQHSACADGRVRGVLQYHGAGPGRWVGRLFQPQNFPRGSLKLDAGTASESVPDVEMVYQALSSGDWRYVESLFGDCFEAVISGLRHSIIAGDGRTLNVGDFNTIEARIVLAIAGAENALKIMADPNRDVYAEMASTIFDMEPPIGKEQIKTWKIVHLAERQTGKNTVLGCGFQMGAPKFKVRYAPDKPLDFAKKCVAAYREDFAPEVPKLWYALDEAGCKAVWDRRPTEAYGLEFRHEDIWLTMRLHSGRKLYYAYPQACKKAMPWDETDIRPAWTCMAQKNGRWIKRDMYGGLLTENAVQAEARDLLVAGMFKAEKNNLPVVLTVHDEIVAEPLTEYSNPDMLGQIMADIPQWARDLRIPVAAETWAGGRYKK